MKGNSDGITEYNESIIPFFIPAEISTGKAKVKVMHSAQNINKYNFFIGLFYYNIILKQIILL